MTHEELKAELARIAELAKTCGWHAAGYMKEYLVMNGYATWQQIVEIEQA
jgi:hypothetical protein